MSQINNIDNNQLFQNIPDPIKQQILNEPD